MTESPVEKLDMNSSPRRVTSLVVEHTVVTAQVRLLVLDAPEVAKTCVPGQFVHIECAPFGLVDPLLRRPLSVHEADSAAGRISILYELRGRGTEVLSRKTVGDEVDILGPLGRGFPSPPSPDDPVVFVAGGIGVAPLYFLARHVAGKVGSREMTLLIGARSECLLTCIDKFRDLGCHVHTATDDGSQGFQGFVTELFQEHMSRIQERRRPVVYASGPMPMLSALSKLTAQHSLTCWVSTEAKMACGVGACLGCAIKVRDGDSWKYVRCCKEGPVFDANEVIWE